MSADFPDHFSAVAANYARYRPTYPDTIFEWIAETAPATGAAWDCGCGNGQATLPLARRFPSVIATDPSAEQLKLAPHHPDISWRVATAEASGLDAGSIDAVTVAQALHWFDLPRFWLEVRRVLRPGGIVAAWSYGVPFLDDAGIAQRLLYLHDEVVGSYWPTERGHVTRRYQGIDFPFERIIPPPFDMRMCWSIDEFAGYLRTWSATQRYIAALGHDPVGPFIDDLRSRWGDGKRDVRWPVTMLAGRATR